jgi:transposase
LLETANIKLSSVMSEVLGKSGRLMLRALVKNEQTPEQMASLALGKLRKKESQLAQALHGKVTDHHRFVLQMQLDRIDAVDADIAKLDKRIDEKLAPYQVQMQRLAQIPGVDRVAAATIIAELGPDMSVFVTAGHAAAWAGVCPGNNESASKKKGQTTRKGNVHLTTALVQAAVCASRKKGSYFKEKFWRLKARRGGKRAAMAIAHKILVAAYYMLRDECDYKDLGGTYLDQLAPEKTKMALVKRLEQLGYKVSLSPLQPQLTEVGA